jgi:hypothetical protein
MVYPLKRWGSFIKRNTPSHAKWDLGRMHSGSKYQLGFRMETLRKQNDKAVRRSFLISNIWRCLWVWNRSVNNPLAAIFYYYFKWSFIRWLTNWLCGAEYRSRGHKLCSHSVVPRILWNPKVHCRVHKSSPPVPIRWQCYYIRRQHKNTHIAQDKIWGFHGGDYEEWCLLGCYAVWFL